MATTLHEARNASIQDGIGHGARPRQVFAVEMTYRPTDPETGEKGRLTRWVAMFPSKAKAKATVEMMNKYPVEDEKVVLLVGSVTWVEEPVGEGH